MKKNIFKSVLILLLVIAGFYFLAGESQAANLQNAFGKNLTDAGSNAGYNEGQTSPLPIISAIINIILSILGVIFLTMLIYGGYEWMTARGNEQRLEKAKDAIRSAIIGLIIIASAYAISSFVLTRISSKTLNQSTPQGTVNQ